MKAEIELTINDSGEPIIKIRHHDKSNALEQKLLGVFLSRASGKMEGIELVQTNGHLAVGSTPPESWENYEIRLKVECKMAE
jgi:hypothetical protein